MSAKKEIDERYRKIREINPFLHYMNYYDELNKNETFGSLINELASFAGYHAGENASEFSKDIIDVCLRYIGTSPF